MRDPHDALARFRAATDAAVEQGRRAVREAAAGLTGPGLPADAGPLGQGGPRPIPAVPAEDEDFSQDRILRRL